MRKHSYEAYPVGQTTGRISGQYVSRDNFVTYCLSRKGKPGTRYTVARFYPGVGWLSQGEYVVEGE
jgi:hypothetical protein